MKKLLCLLLLVSCKPSNKPHDELYQSLCNTKKIEDGYYPATAIFLDRWNNELPEVPDSFRTIKVQMVDGQAKSIKNNGTYTPEDATAVNLRLWDELEKVNKCIISKCGNSDTFEYEITAEPDWGVNDGLR